MNSTNNQKPIGFTNNQNKLINEINKLKKEKDAIILVHNYQRPEIYEVANFIGDSYDLSKKAASSKAKTIIFCGVRFMAETAKILNPNKTVLLPAKNAGCPLADTITAQDIRKLKKENHGAATVCYINTPSEVKAECDYCCTSKNAIDIVNSIKNEKIIFVPDKNLGEYVKTKTGKNLILWTGNCYVHSQISAETIKLAKIIHPEAKVIAHPECPAEVLKLTDCICGTGGMIKYAKESPANEFIVATEIGMSHRLKREIPNKEFYPAGHVCFNQKFITLEKIRDSLLKNQYVIEVPEEITKKALASLEKMMEN